VSNPARKAGQGHGADPAVIGDMPHVDALTREGLSVVDRDRARLSHRCCVLLGSLGVITPGSLSHQASSLMVGRCSPTHAISTRPSLAMS
jgi:hypothetical protein